MRNVGYGFDRTAHEGTPNRRGQRGRALRISGGHRSCEKLGTTPLAPRCKARLEVWQAQALGRDGEFVSRFRALAGELDMAVAPTHLERWDGPPRNSVSLVDCRGEIVMTCAEVHTCDFDLPEATLTPGDELLRLRP
jgi:hypothetical protein